MIKVEVGGDYSAKKVFRGTTDKGEQYECAIVGSQNPKEKREIKIWCKPPVGLQTGDNFRIEKMLSVKSAAKKFNEKWIDETHVDAQVSPLMNYAQFTELNDDSEGLPF